MFPLPHRAFQNADLHSRRPLFVSVLSSRGSHIDSLDGRDDSSYILFDQELIMGIVEGFAVCTLWSHNSHFELLCVKKLHVGCCCCFRASKGNLSRQRSPIGFLAGGSHREMSSFHQRRDTTCNLIEIGIRIPKALLKDAFIGNTRIRGTSDCSFKRWVSFGTTDIAMLAFSIETKWRDRK